MSNVPVFVLKQGLQDFPNLSDGLVVFLTRGVHFRQALANVEADVGNAVLAHFDDDGQQPFHHDFLSQGVPQELAAEEGGEAAAVARVQAQFLNCRENVIDGPVGAKKFGEQFEILGGCRSNRGYLVP